MTVKIPDQVKRGLEEAEAIEAAMAAPPPAAEPETADPPPPPPAPPEPPAPPAENWEQKYHSLKGMYDADVPRLNKQVKELTTQVANLEAQVAAKPPEPAPEPKQPLPGISDKDREAFGDDLMEAIERAAQAIADKQTAPLLAKIEKLETQAAAVTEQVTTVADAQIDEAKTKYFGKLTELVPDWLALNGDAQFLAWCGADNPLTGQPNQALLDDAFNKLDVSRTAALFNQYKADKGIVAAPATDPAKAELESQIAPSSAHTTAPSTPPAEKIWTVAEVSKFYDDITKGVYRGKEREVAEIEAAIDQATAEGRLR